MKRQRESTSPPAEHKWQNNNNIIDSGIGNDPRRDAPKFHLNFVRPAQMQLFARVLCHPPLGQALSVPSDQLAIQFNVVIESSKSFPDQGWEAVIWHNGHQGGKWAGLTLEKVAEPSAAPLALGSDDRPNVYRYYFTGRLPTPADGDPIDFTLKYRTVSSDTWKWVKDTSSIQDGVLYFQPKEIPPELHHYLKGGFLSNFNIKSLVSEVPHTQLWHLQQKHARNSDEYNHAEDAVLSAFFRLDGLHLVILPISGIKGFLTVLKSDSNGNIILNWTKDFIEYDYKSQVLVAVGRTFEAALAAAVYQARRLVADNQLMKSQEIVEVERLPEIAPQPTWMENWYDGLTYCTWNALGQNLDQQRIFDALDILKANNIKITNLIIDDNWQSLDNAGESHSKRGWTEFEANKEGFPEGLRYAVTEIRDNNPDIQHVAVWHALFGYWGGISPTGDIAKNYKTKTLRKQPAGGFAEDTITVVDADDAARYFNDFYQFLLESRIDSVKTDAQFFLDLLEDPKDRYRFITAYQDAWTIASLRYFSTKAISCMSQVPQIIFHTQLPADKPRLVVRNSDDYFPDVPASHPWHIFANAHNSLFTSHLNVVPDWDMFQTSHPYASFHAAGRCVSGGPITITDKPGEHDISLISQITAETIQGKTVTLRPDVVGKSVDVYNPYEAERLLKIGTFVGGKGGISILGCFNVSERALYELVHLSDFRGIEEDDEYAIYSFKSGKLSPSMTLDCQFPMVLLEMDSNGWEILTAYPLRSFTLRGSQGKMTGAAALVGSSMEIEETGRLRVKATLKALGVLGIYISSLPSLSIKDHFIILIYNQAIPVHTVSLSKTSTSVLEIDIKRAWDEMGLDSAWNNELSVDIFIK
ncbi:MAG: hypothetical protein Q9191_007492 [Dirinaria sp. TL-2023a]